jgi:hypothetical protein
MKPREYIALPLLQGLGICFVIVLLGFYALHENAPAIVSWGTIIIFGSMFVLGGIALLHQTVKGTHPIISNEPGNGFGLRRGRDHAVEVNDRYVALADKRSGEVKQLAWTEITAVYVIAIDAFPLRIVSLLLYDAGDVLDIPVDAEGGYDVPEFLQEKLPGFDRKRLSEALGMTHGLKKIWFRP